MFCPQCSQQQVSGDARFCPRCGLPLEGVATLLANGGMLPSPAAAAEGTVLGPPSPRLKGVRQGITLFLLGTLIVPLLILLVEELHILPEGVAMAAAMMLFIGAFVRIAYAFLVEDGPLRRQRLPASAAQPAATPVLPGARASALPPAPGTPIEAYVPPRADTAEIARRPPSVTEGTTRLLDKEER